MYSWPTNFESKLLFSNNWRSIFARALFLSAISLGVATLLELAAPLLIGALVDRVTLSPGSQPADIGAAYALRWLSQRSVGVLCTAFLGVITCRMLFDTLQAATLQRAGLVMTQRLRERLFFHLEHLPMSFYDANATGRLVSRVVNDVRAVSDLFTASVSVLVLDTLTIVGTVVLLVFLSPLLSLTVLIPLPIMGLITFGFGKKMAKAYRRVRLLAAEMTGFLAENIRAHSLIQLFAAEAKQENQFNEILKQHHEAQLETVHIMSLVQPSANILNGLALAGLVGLGGRSVLLGHTTLGMLVAFLGYQKNIFQPLRDIVEKINLFLSAMVSSERITQLLHESTEARPLASAMATQKHEGSTLSLGMSFKNVSFRYPGRDTLALAHIDLEIPSGLSIGIVGPTGSGKSTLGRLLLRFYEPLSGDIFIGPTNIQALALPDLRAQVGYVPQDVLLFEGSLWDNLTLGRENAAEQGGRDLVIEKLEQLGAWPLFERRGGLDLKLHEGGHNLSAGERQLISFARVLLADPPILLLDEATSSLDRHTESLLLRAMRTVIKGRTSLIIAHRTSTIRHCDRVVALRDGHLASL